MIKVLNGAYRGSCAILKELDENNFSVTIEIASGPLKGRIIKKIEYEDISKVHQS
jgi:DNA/RNA-binding protein KIN17